eukprot:1878556-Prymnesium_polylepis.3
MSVPSPGLRPPDWGTVPATSPPRHWLPLGTLGMRQETRAKVSKGTNERIVSCTQSHTQAVTHASANHAVSISGGALLGDGGTCSTRCAP